MEEVDVLLNLPEKPAVKKKSKIKKILKWSFISLFSLLFLLITSAFILVYFFEDDIKKYAIDQINQEVNTKIEVEDIKLSFFKKFPMASLEFVNVKCLEVTDKEPKASLLEAESVFLEFSIWDIFRGKYKFTKLSIENGKVDLKIDKYGKTNFDIIKKKKPGQEKKKQEMSFRFREFKLKNMHFSFQDKKQMQEYRAQIKKMTCSGAFTEKNYTIKTKVHFLSEVISTNNDDFLTNKNIFINTSLQINRDQKLCTINAAHIELENMKVGLSGSIKFDSTAYVDLSFKGENLNIQSFLSLLPNSYKTFENKYKSNGDFYLNGTVKGSLADKALPHLVLNFGIEKGRIRFVEEDIEMKEIHFQGNFNSGTTNSPESAELNINSFQGKLEKSTFSGNFHLKDLAKPYLKFTIDADVDLQEVFKFIPVEKIESISGRVKAQLSYEGKLNGNSFTFDDYKKSVANGKATMENVSIQIKNKPVNLSNCSGEVIFENNIGAIPHLKGKIASTEFSLKGSVVNLPEYFYLDNYPLIIDADIELDKIKVEEFLTSTVDEKNKKESGFDIPANIDLKLQAHINDLSFKKFSAKNISGFLMLKEKKLFAENLKFESCGGTAEISGSVNTSDPDNMITQAYGSFDKINITSLFFQFENFSQTAIEDKHLKGTTKANIAYSASFDRGLKMKLNSLYVNSPIEIKMGELIAFKPLEGLSKFIHVEELRHIKFSTLTNTIEIKDEAVIIPKMVIQSTALNLEIGGIHYFDNRIEYYFNVFLKDLIAAKWKKNRKEDEFGEIIEEEGGARIYLKMVGTMDNYTITIDRKGVKEKFKEDMKKQGQDLKQIFYEEFGAFKNDSTVKKSTLIPPKKENKNKVKESEEFEFE